MHPYESVRILALRAVADPDNDPEYHLRHVSRWYSKTFNTPLAEVDDLPVDELLRAYWEDQFETMDPGELHIELEKAIMTEEEKKKSMMEVDADQAADTEFLKLAQQQNTQKQKQSKNIKMAPKTEQTSEKTDIPKLMPDIDMIFEDEGPEVTAGPRIPPKRR